MIYIIMRLSVTFIRHQMSCKERILNVNKMRVVDLQIAWDMVNSRPIGDTRPLLAPGRFLDIYQNVSFWTIKRGREPDDLPIIDDISNREVGEMTSEPSDASNDEVDNRSIEIGMPTTRKWGYVFHHSDNSTVHITLKRPREVKIALIYPQIAICMPISPE